MSSRVVDLVSFPGLRGTRSSSSGTILAPEAPLVASAVLAHVDLLLGDSSPGSILAPEAAVISEDRCKTVFTLEDEASHTIEIENAKKRELLSQLPWMTRKQLYPVLQKLGVHPSEAPPLGVDMRDMAEHLLRGILSI
jgi:hypothetical protein